ncbi:MAG: PIN domain-containing protein [Bacteroidia bacterium]|jgi:predicted nucleic acid-binding protein
MRHFLLDTNVVIDFLTDRRPFSTWAARLFTFAEKGKVKLYVSAVSYNNTYYIIKKLTSHKHTLHILNELEAMTETIDISGDIVRQALATDFKDFEDALQYSSARSNKKIEAIVTRNRADFKTGKLSVLSPEEAKGMLESDEH